MKNVRKEIKYLGELTWEEAIEKAMSLDMVIPNYRLMNKILEALNRQQDIQGYDFMPHQFNTSTTYAFNTRKFVLPIDKDVEIIQLPDSVENSYKSIKRNAFAVSKDTTETDIYTFNFYFTNLDKNK